MVEEKPPVKLDGPAQVIKDIVDGKYGSDTIHNRTRCGALFSDLIDNIKNRNLLEVLLKLGVAEQLKKDNSNLNDSDKTKLIHGVCTRLIKDYFSCNRLNEGLNWYTKALLGIEGNWFSADDISSACDVVVSERKQTISCWLLTLSRERQPLTATGSPLTIERGGYLLSANGYKLTANSL